MRVLVVEDSRRLRDSLRTGLRRSGFSVDCAGDGPTGLSLAAHEPYDLIVLDLMLPGKDGLCVLQELRARGVATDVLILSARQATPEKVRALSLGADDFLTKPFWPEELLARIDARLRRPGLQRQGKVRTGDLLIDLEGRSVTAEGSAVTLTRVEFDLLAALARRLGTAVERGWLTDHVLDPENNGTDRTLDVHVSRLRKKLGTAGSRVTTVWGVGYRLEAPSSA